MNLRFCLFFLSLLTGLNSFGQSGGPASGSAVIDPSGAGSDALPVNISAERSETRDNQKFIILNGNVMITQGEDVLKADYVSLNTETYDAHARGNVYVLREGRVYEGDEIRYNFATRQGDFTEFDIQDGPFFITSEQSERLSEDEFVLYDATITTCGWDSPEFQIKAEEAFVTRNDRLHARNVVMYYYGVPVFYLPWMTKHIGDSQTNIDVVPGYSSRMGGFLLTAYNYELNNYLNGVTHLDFRSKRGFGFGQDFLWQDRAEGRWQGDFRMYYANDDKPLDDGSMEGRSPDLVDSDRYRFRLNHRQGLSDFDTARVRLNYLSDPFVLEDFFDREFKLNTVPENFATLTHRDPRYTLTLNVIPRLNDFYSTVNRLPELVLEVPQFRIADTPVFYDGVTSLAYLERTYPDGSAQEDYDAFRFDTDHTLSYPTRHFDFLNVIPRAGYRGTFYDKTLSLTTNTVPGIQVDSAGVTSVVDEAAVTVNEEGGELRSLFELGFETSFKAFKVLSNYERNDFDVGLRHVVEPRMDYTFVPEPNLEPEQIFQFDEIDQLDERNDVLVGLRNKWQTKRRGEVHDLLDVDFFTVYDLDPDPIQEDFSDIFFDAELRWVDGLWVDVDGRYDTYNSEFSVANLQAALRFKDGSSLAGEYRFARDRRDQVAAELNLMPEERVSYTGYLRYDLDLSNLEEHSHFVRWQTDCIGYGIGIRQLAQADGDDEIRVWGQIWLTAFPESIANLGR